MFDKDIMIMIMLLRNRRALLQSRNADGHNNHLISKVDRQIRKWEGK